MNFTSAKTFQRVELADGKHRFEKLWFGGHRVGDTFMSFICEDGDILLEIVFTNTRGPKFYTIPIVRELIELG